MAAFSFESRLKHLNGSSSQVGYSDLVRASARRRPDHIALVFRNRTYTYGQLHAEICALARVLRDDYGLVSGARVAIHLENSDAYVIGYFAILTLGAVAIPINPKYVARELAHVLADTKPALYLSEPKFLQVFREAAGAHPAPQWVELSGLLDAPRRFGADLPSPDIDGAAAIFYTSGTTGFAKGVVHTHRTLLAGAWQGPLAWEYEAEDLVNLAITPLFHIASHTWFFPAFSVGSTLVVDTYQTERVLDLITQASITSVSAVPSMLLMMVESAAEKRITLPEVQVVRFGASPMPADKLSAVQRLFPNARLVHGMGQTESCGTLVTLPSSKAFAKAGSVGVAIEGCEIKLVDDNDREVGPGCIGELAARGPNVMLGYLNRTEETAKTLANGWLHTGDLGYLDQDGFLFLVDRKKDMIIRGGENVYSAEVENVIYMQDSVALAAVVGMPDPLFGEEVVAFVVPKAGMSIDAATMQSFCSKHLAAYKCPRKIFVEQALPMTATGKIQKNLLKEKIAH